MHTSDLSLVRGVDKKHLQPIRRTRCAVKWGKEAIGTNIHAFGLFYEIQIVAGRRNTTSIYIATTNDRRLLEADIRNLYGCSLLLCVYLNGTLKGTRISNIKTLFVVHGAPWFYKDELRVLKPRIVKPRLLKFKRNSNFHEFPRGRSEFALRSRPPHLPIHTAESVARNPFATTTIRETMHFIKTKTKVQHE